MNILQRLFEKSLAPSQMRVVDTQAFLNLVENLKFYQFKSQAARDTIQAMSDLNKIIKNHAELARDLKFKADQKINSQIATSAEGAFMMKAVRALTDLLFRNFSPEILFGAFRQPIEQMTIRHNLMIWALFTPKKRWSRA